jgi:hypothetical protein
MLIAAFGIIVSYTFTPMLFRNILHEPQKAEMAISFCKYVSGAFLFCISIKCGMHCLSALIKANI